jgi:hypothetical protein
LGVARHPRGSSKDERPDLRLRDLLGASPRPAEEAREHVEVHRDTGEIAVGPPAGENAPKLTARLIEGAGQTGSTAGAVCERRRWQHLPRVVGEARLLSREIGFVGDTAGGEVKEARVV